MNNLNPQQNLIQRVKKFRKKKKRNSPSKVLRKSLRLKERLPHHLQSMKIRKRWTPNKTSLRNNKETIQKDVKRSNRNSNSIKSLATSET